jgi:hypothetical protein
MIDDDERAKAKRAKEQKKRAILDCKTDADEEVLTKPKPKLKSYIKAYDDKNVKFVLQGLEFAPTHKSLRLQKPLSLDNMVLLNEDDTAMKYPTVESLFEAFHERRYPYYELRKTDLLNKLLNEYIVLHERMSFIMAVLDDKLVLKHPGQKNPRQAAEIERDAVSLGLNPKVYKELKLNAVTAEKVQKLWKIAEEKRKEHEILSKTPASELWLRDLDELEKHLPY